MDDDGGRSRRAMLGGLLAAGIGTATLGGTTMAARAPGEREWWFKDANFPSSPTVVDGTVYVGSTIGRVFALDAASGDVQWVVETGDGHITAPNVVDGTVYAANDRTGVLHALDAASGEERWQFDGDTFIGSSPTVADGTVFVTGAGGSLYALSAATGETAWTFRTKSSLRSSPTVAGGIVVFESLRNVYALDVATGAQQWAFESGGRSSPTVVDGTVYVGSEDANVYALRAGVDAESEGSRVRLGTLGHHSGRRVE